MILRAYIMDTLFSLISLLLSLTAIVITYLVFRKTHKRTVQPIIVFSNVEKEDGDKTSWCIENVGNGPALNVLVAGGTTQLEWNDGDKTLIAVMGCNVSRRLDWVRLRGAFLATYKDIYGREYTSICVHNKHTITEGNSYRDLEPKKFGYQLDDKKA